MQYTVIAMERAEKLMIDGGVKKEMIVDANDDILYLRNQYASSANRVDEHMFISGYLAAADSTFIQTNDIKFILKAIAKNLAKPSFVKK